MRRTSLPPAAGSSRPRLKPRGAKLPFDVARTSAGAPVERLEVRELMSASAVLRDDGTLVIHGTRRGDQLRVRMRQSDPLKLDVFLNDLTTAADTFDVAKVTSIQMFGHGGRDELRVDESHGFITRPALLDGGAGNDLLVGASGDDTLVGDEGNDTLIGDDGADRLDGGRGNDELDGNNGDDVLLGGDGNDAIDGSFGDDAADGGAGDDTIDGGAGDDGVLGAQGADDLAGGPGNDRLDGGRDHDDLDGGDGNDTLVGGRSDDDALHGGGGNDKFARSDDADEIDDLNPGDAHGKRGVQQPKTLSRGLLRRLTRAFGK